MIVQESPPRDGIRSGNCLPHRDMGPISRRGVGLIDRSIRGVTARLDARCPFVTGDSRTVTSFGQLSWPLSLDAAHAKGMLVQANRFKGSTESSVAASG